MAIPGELSSLKHFINLRDVTAEQFRALLQFAIERKRDLRAGKLGTPLAGKVLAMYFEKPSLRTRVSFDVAMSHLGGSAIYLTPAEIGLGKREAVQDIARVLSGMCDAFMLRTFSHEIVEKIAEFASIPVINGLTDWSHPCQAAADLMTLMEQRGDLAGARLVFVGDGNNVARSLAEACALLGMQFVLASPKGYELDAAFLKQVSQMAAGFAVEMTHDARDAVRGADAIYTDTWASMGQEAEAAKRRRDFAGFTVNNELLKLAKPEAVVLHCLPAHRGEEITDEVMDGPQSAIFAEAENRLHVQRALLEVLVR